MLHVAKISLISSCTSFVREGGALRGWKKKVPPFKSLAAPLPSPPLGKLFRLPYSLAPFRLYQYTQFKLNVHYLFIYAVTLEVGLYGMLSEYPTLFYTKGLLFRIPRLFLITYLFQATQRWALLYMFQASKCSCGFASTLPWSRWTDLLLIISSLTILTTVLSIRRCVYAQVC